MHTATTEVPVRYAETDQMGVVYHANYLVYEEAVLSPRTKRIISMRNLCLLAGYSFLKNGRFFYFLEEISFQFPKLTFEAGRRK